MGKKNKNLYFSDVKDLLLLLDFWHGKNNKMANFGKKIWN